MTHQRPPAPAYPDAGNRAHGRALLSDLDWLLATRRHRDHAPINIPPVADCWICREGLAAADRIMAREVGC